MRISLKKSKQRIQIKTLKGKSGYNYIIIRSWDDNSNNWEYNVFAEVGALQAAYDCWEGKTPLTKNLTTREAWDIVWRGQPKQKKES